MAALLAVEEYRRNPRDEFLQELIGLASGMDDSVVSATVLGALADELVRRAGSSLVPCILLEHLALVLQLVDEIDANSVDWVRCISVESFGRNASVLEFILYYMTTTRILIAQLLCFVDNNTIKSALGVCSNHRLSLLCRINSVRIFLISVCGVFFCIVYWLCFIDPQHPSFYLFIFD